MATDMSVYGASFEHQAISVVRVKKLLEVVDEHFLALPQPETDDDIRHIQMLGMYRGLLMLVM
jgi:hypothetical protein